MNNAPRKVRIFVDADVLFAAAASGSEHGASLVVLRLGEITLIDLFTSQQVIDEVERNLHKKLPTALTLFRLLVEKSIDVLPNAPSSLVENFDGQADSKDLPILVTAIQAEVDWLLTFNSRHFYPPSDNIRIAQPGTFIQELRHLLTSLSDML